MFKSDVTNLINTYANKILIIAIDNSNLQNDVIRVIEKFIPLFDCNSVYYKEIYFVSSYPKCIMTKITTNEIYKSFYNCFSMKQTNNKNIIQNIFRVNMLTCINDYILHQPIDKSLIDCRIFSKSYDKDKELSNRLFIINNRTSLLYLCTDYTFNKYKYRDDIKWVDIMNYEFQHTLDDHIIDELKPKYTKYKLDYNTGQLYKSNIYTNDQQDITIKLFRLNDNNEYDLFVEQIFTPQPLDINNIVEYMHYIRINIQNKIQNKTHYNDVNAYIDIDNELIELYKIHYHNSELRYYIINMRRWINNNIKANAKHIDLKSKLLKKFIEILDDEYFDKKIVQNMLKFNDSKANDIINAEKQALEVFNEDENNNNICINQFFSSLFTLTDWSEELQDGSCLGILINVKKGVNNNIKILDIINFISVYDWFTMVTDQSQFKTFGGDTNYINIQGPIMGTGNIVIPLYISKSHWILSRIWLEYMLGITIHNNPFNYRDQNINFVFYLLSVMNINIMDNHNSNHINTYIAIFRTCVEIAKEREYYKGLGKMINNIATNKNTLIPSTNYGNIILLSQIIVTGVTLSPILIESFVRKIMDSFIIESIMHNYTIEYFHNNIKPIINNGKRPTKEFDSICTFIESEFQDILKSINATYTMIKVFERFFKTKGLLKFIKSIDTNGGIANNEDIELLQNIIKEENDKNKDNYTLDAYYKLKDNEQNQKYLVSLIIAGLTHKPNEFKTLLKKDIDTLFNDLIDKKNEIHKCL